MRVLVNAVSARQGGILTYTRNLITALEKRGVTAAFAVPDIFPVPASDTILPQCASAYRAPPRLLWDQIVWRNKVARFKPDVLYSSANFGLLRSPVPQILLLREGGLFDPFYLANLTAAQGLRLSVLRSWRRQMMITSARNADLVLTPTLAMRDSFLRWAPELSERCQANAYGTLDGAFVPPEQPRAWCADGTLRLLYVSVYYAHKNPGTLVRAVQRLNEAGTPTHARITMESAEVKSTPGGAADHLLLGRGVDRGQVTLGRHPYAELPALYGGHDVFVFPSVSETFGHPMAEALSSGLPVIAADHPVNHEICGDAALYFSPFSVSQLVDCVRRLAADPGLRAEMVRRGRERILAMYTWDSHVDRLVEHFERVAFQRR